MEAEDFGDVEEAAAVEVPDEDCRNFRLDRPLDGRINLLTLLLFLFQVGLQLLRLLFQLFSILGLLLTVVLQALDFLFLGRQRIQFVVFQLHQLLVLFGQLLGGFLDLLRLLAHVTGENGVVSHAAEHL